MPGTRNGTEFAIVSNARHEKKSPNAKKSKPTAKQIKRPPLHRDGLEVHVLKSLTKLLR